MRLTRPFAAAVSVALAVSPAVAYEHEDDPLSVLLALHRVMPQQLDVSADPPDRWPPAGVRGTRLATPGEWTFSYRYSRSDMSGLIDGDGDVDEQEVFDDGYAEIPTRMVREEHLFTGLFGLSEELSLLVTIPWINADMDLETSTGEDFSLRSTGFGDLRLDGIYMLSDGEERDLLLNLGLTLPTGSTDEKDDSPTAPNVKLPYQAQLGSGTIDLIPGVAYTRHVEGASWGLQASQTVRVGENSDDYTLGNRTLATAWASRVLRDELSGSLRATYEHLGRIDGEDDDLDATVNPANDPDVQGGDRLDFFLGLNYSHVGGHHFSAEIGGPVFQDLNGPQLETDVMYLLTWQISF